MKKRIFQSTMAILAAFSLTACGTGSGSGQAANNKAKSIRVEIDENAGKSMVSGSASKSASAETSESTSASKVKTTDTVAESEMGEKSEPNPLSVETAAGSSKTETTETASGAASSTPHTKEVYNCCGFITDSGVTIKMAGIRGDSIVALVNLLDYAKQDKTVNGYDFSIASSTEEAAEKLINGELDMAILPIETAAKLYNDSKGKVRMVATTVIDTNKKWNKENKKKHSLAGIFTTSDFVREKKNAVDGLIGDYSYSAMWVTAEKNQEAADKLIKEYDVSGTEKAKKAIASGKIACLRGETMKKAAKTYLGSLKKVDKKAIGELPKDNFYYIRDAK